jgi:hypothetical protein
VRDALAAPSTPETRATSPLGVQARLVSDEDGSQMLQVWLNRRQTFPSRFRVEEVPEERTGPFAYLLAGDRDENDPGHLLLEGGLGWLGPGASFLRQRVDEGVLLFIQQDDGIWVAASSRPQEGMVRVLVRDRLAHRFACRAPGGRGRKSSRYPGWWEFTRLPTAELPVAGVDDVPDVGLLRKSLSPVRIVLAGGVRVGDGWLGADGCLPVAWAAGERLTVRSATHDAVEIDLHCDNEGAWRFPRGSCFAGPHVLRAWSAGAVCAVHRLQFVGGPARHNFLAPGEAADWLIEGGGNDLVAYSDAEGALCEEGVAAQPLQAGSLADDPQLALLPGVEDLVDTLAARCLRRRGIPDAELLDRFSSLVGDDGPLWPTIRAWQESGAIDRLSFRRWRRGCSFARPPRLVAFRTPHGIAATLFGLAPQLVRRQVLETSAAVNTLCSALPARSPLAPPLLRVLAPSWQALERISNEACLEPPAWVRAPGVLASSIREIRAQRKQKMPIGLQERAGTWDRARCAFIMNLSCPGPALDRLRNDAGPDVYVLRSPGQDWWSSSRNAALLAAYDLWGDRPFTPTGASSLHANLAGPYLPLPLARFAAVVGTAAPGPGRDEDGRWRYTYHLATPTDRRNVMSALLPPSSEPARGRRVRWLQGLILAGVGGPSVPVPAYVRRMLARDAGSAALATLSTVPAAVLPHLVAFSRNLPLSEAT